MVRNLDALASLHQRIGNLGRALDSYVQSRSELEARGLEIEAAWSLRNAAAIRAALGDPEAARSDALAATATHAAAGLVLEQIDDNLLLAEIADMGEDPERTEQHLARAGELADQVGHAPSRLRLRLVRARLDLDNGRPSAALERLAGVEPELESAPAEVRALALGSIARAHAALGDLDSAVQVGTRAVDAVEHVRRRFGSAERRTTYLADRVDVYGDLAAALFGLGRVGEGLAVVDAARGRGISARIGTARGDAPAIAAAAAGDQLLARVSHLTAKLDSAAGDTYMTEAIRAQLDEARGAYDTAYRDARERLGADATLLGVGDLDPAAVQSALGPRELLIEYLVADERLWAVAVTRGAIRPFATEISREELAARVRIARDLSAAPENGRDVVGPVMEALHDALLGPIARSGLLANAEQLTLVPHTILNYLPLVALVDPLTGRFLVEDHDVLQLPSAAAVPALAARPDRPGPGRPWLFAPKNDELPHTADEVRRIAGALESSRRYLGRRGTEARARAALEEGAWVHVATHGVMNAQNPMFSRIELAPGRSGDHTDDGRLEVHEILEMRIRSGLVFLSGCETGVGSAWATIDGRGEDQTTLERALLYAGAANVVATLWPIEDAGAAELAAEFYRRPSDAERPAAALSRAQRALLNSGEWSAPYYWAAYRLSGTNRPMS